MSVSMPYHPYGYGFKQVAAKVKKTQQSVKDLFRLISSFLSTKERLKILLSNSMDLTCLTWANVSFCYHFIIPFRTRLLS